MANGRGRATAITLGQRASGRRPVFAALALAVSAGRYIHTKELSFDQGRFGPASPPATEVAVARPVV